MCRKIAAISAVKQYPYVVEAQPGVLGSWCSSGECASEVNKRLFFFSLLPLPRFIRSRLLTTSQLATSVFPIRLSFAPEKLQLAMTS